MELTPRIVPRPTAPFSGNTDRAVSELSFTLNDNSPNKVRSNSINTRTIHSRSSPLTNGHTKYIPPSITKNPSPSLVKNNYSPDPRLKFYQKLQTKVNEPIERKTPTISSSSALDNSLPLQQNNQQLCPREKYPSNDRDLMKYAKNDDENITQLYRLVEKQNQQIASLEMQVKMLHTMQQEYLHNSKSQNNIDLRQLLDVLENRNKHQEIQQKQIQMPDKMSIGVMTSFEFTSENIIKNYNTDNSANNGNKEKPIAVTPREPFSPAKSQLEKIIENPETQLSICNKEKIVDNQSYHSNPIVGDINDARESSEDGENSEIIKATSTSKVGWTFYNNVLHQVNDILHNSTEMNNSKRFCDTQQKCTTTKQVKIIETMITTELSNVEQSNYSDKNPMDSSYYPKVNYQANMQAWQSVTETSASMHMKALACKYLGDKYQSDGHIPRRSIDAVSHFITENSPDNNLSLATKNYIEKYQLASDKNINPTYDRNGGESNILDISILKRQPKLL